MGQNRQTDGHCFWGYNTQVKHDSTKNIFTDTSKNFKSDMQWLFEIHIKSNVHFLHTFIVKYTFVLNICFEYFVLNIEVFQIKFS